MLSTEMVTKLASYFGGNLSLSELREWEAQMFVRRNTLTSDERQFLFAFERHYGELTAGLPEEAFKSLLRSLVSSLPPITVLIETETTTTIARPHQTGAISALPRWPGLNEGSEVTLTELIPA